MADQSKMLKGALSTYLANRYVDALVRGVPMQAPAQVFLGLHRSDPTDAGTAGAITTAAQRVAITIGASVPSQPAGQPGYEVFNNSRTKVPQPADPTATPPVVGTANPFTSAESVTHFSLWDGNTGAANLLFRGAFLDPVSGAAAPVLIPAGGTFDLAAGALIVALDVGDGSATGGLALTDAAEQALLNATFVPGQATTFLAADAIIRLFSTNPTDADNAGPALTFNINTPQYVAATPPANGQVSNTAPADFTGATVAATATHVKIGNELSGPLAQPVPIPLGGNASFAPGTLVVSLT